MIIDIIVKCHVAQPASAQNTESLFSSLFLNQPQALGLVLLMLLLFDDGANNLLWQAFFQGLDAHVEASQWERISVEL